MISEKALKGSPCNTECVYMQFNQAMLNLRSLSQFTCMEKNILQEKRKNINHFKSLH